MHGHTLMVFVTNAMKTLNTSFDGKSDQPTSRWIEVKVCHLINAYFRLDTFCNLVSMRFK